MGVVDALELLAVWFFMIKPAVKSKIRITPVLYLMRSFAKYNLMGTFTIYKDLKTDCRKTMQLITAIFCQWI